MEAFKKKIAETGIAPDDYLRRKYPDADSMKKFAEKFLQFFPPMTFQKYSHSYNLHKVSYESIAEHKPHIMHPVCVQFW